MHAPAAPTWALALFALALAIRLGVGIWILARAARLRGFAELVLGAFVLLVALGEAASLAAAHLRGVMGESAVLPLIGVGLLLLVGGHVALVFATIRIFRAENRSALAVACGLSVLLSVAAALRLFADAEPSVLSALTPANVALLLGRLATDFWWGAESHRFGRRLRKQAALGLADASRAWRFDLWTLSAAGHAAILVTMLWCAIVLRAPAASSPAALAVMCAAGLISAAAIQASFRPRKRERSEMSGAH